MPINQPSQNFDDYVLPSSEFLTLSEPHLEQSDDELLATAQEITDKLREFNITGRVVHISQGPIVSIYEYKLDPGVKFSRISRLADDLCLALKVESVRIDRIPGKAFVGIEIPNRQRETIYLREVIESKKFCESNSLLTIALGKTVDGLNYVADLAKTPHLLIAGATGTGKSVAVNSLIVSILYKAKPDEVKFIMVDQKRVELGLYADIPHLATPIITDSNRAAIALKWAVSEMEKRYKDLAGWGVRDIDAFNTEIKKRNSLEQLDENGESWRILPYIVIVIEEFANLMMTSNNEAEDSIIRLAQTARAVGIHLVLATEKPSSDIINGLIKTNFPSRIAFRVPARIDSRTVLDTNGAEKLFGRGDMFFLSPNASDLVRVHGAFVNEREIHRIVEHIKAQGLPEYQTTAAQSEEEKLNIDDLPGKRDPLFADSLRVVVAAKSASTSLLQRHLRIGYGRAAAILDAMVREGYVGDMDGSSRARPILQKAYETLEETEVNSFSLPQEIEKQNNPKNKGFNAVNQFENYNNPKPLEPSKANGETSNLQNYGITIFGLISIFSFVVSCGSCVGFLSRVGDKKNAYGYLDSSTDLWLGRFTFGFIIGLLLAFVSFIIAAVISAWNDPPSGSSNYTGYSGYKTPKAPRGRPPKLFKRSKKSSIIKSIKRDIKKYGD